MNITRLIVSTVHNNPDNLVYKVNYEARDQSTVAGTLLLVYKLEIWLIGLDATRHCPVGIWRTKREMMGTLSEKYSCPVREM